MKYKTDTITATGSSNGVSHGLNLNGPDILGVIGVSGTFTGATFIVEKKLQGGSVWYPVIMIDQKTGARGTGSAAPSDSTTTSWMVDLRGASDVRIYCSAGTPTSVTVEVGTGKAEEFGGPLQISPLTFTSVSTFGAGITLNGATTVNVLSIPDNLADALSISEGANGYITFVTTNSAEAMLHKKQMFSRVGNPIVSKLTAATITTVGAGTYTAAQVIGGLVLRDPNGASRTDTTHTAAQLVTALPNVAVDDTFPITIVNTADAAEVITLAGGSGVTLVPATITIAQNEVFHGLVRFTNVTGSSEAVTIYGGNVAG